LTIASRICGFWYLGIAANRGLVAWKKWGITLPTVVNVTQTAAVMGNRMVANWFNFVACIKYLSDVTVFRFSGMEFAKNTYYPTMRERF